MEKREDALGIFRKLLRSNPHDNIGARNCILALCLGLKPDYEEQLTAKDNPEYLDAFKVMDWFEKESEKFSDEFGWWWEVVNKNN